MRHMLVHGALSSYNPKSRSVEFVKLRAGKTEHKQVRRKYSFDQMLKGGDECIGLADGFRNLARRLIDSS